MTDALTGRSGGSKVARVTGDDILRKWMGSTKACGKVVVCGAVKRTLMRPPLCACLKPLTQIGVRITYYKLKQYNYEAEIFEMVAQE